MLMLVLVAPDRRSPTRRATAFEARERAQVPPGGGGRELRHLGMAAATMTWSTMSEVTGVDAGLGRRAGHRLTAATVIARIAARAPASACARLCAPRRPELRRLGRERSASRQARAARRRGSTCRGQAVRAARRPRLQLGMIGVALDVTDERYAARTARSRPPRRRLPDAIEQRGRRPSCCGSADGRLAACAIRNFRDVFNPSRPRLLKPGAPRAERWSASSSWPCAIKHRHVIAGRARRRREVELVRRAAGCTCPSASTAEGGLVVTAADISALKRQERRPAARTRKRTCRRTVRALGGTGGEAPNWPTSPTSTMRRRPRPRRPTARRASSWPI